ncbi:hypothetical protein [Legionella worsleiensis]|uniref:Substrate of the Dot/Icm secretion system n=1 Tax=Legionella worsleiensis TaxID=45076 RepID=A0A0W1A355_9GAMM|nr:hypothetical protein [Legionella worsleiensis]KTD75799.1 substrate of the Dot/Icm secretion system [Legionella worsleiensis]STY32817.1 Dot/Icm secretion system substrate [Legionella worsleiensis]
MKFFLKDFESLKAGFYECYEFMHKRKTTIDERRKDGLEFLKMVIEELDSQIAREKTPNLVLKLNEKCASVLYGAMCMIKEDIERNRRVGESNGKMFEYMDKSMGIDDENKPSPQQYVTFYKTFNQFMRQIYIKNNSLHGFNTRHKFMSLPLEKLVQFVKTSFELEQTAHEHVNNNLKTEDPISTDIPYFRVARAISPVLVQPYKSFWDLKEKLRQLIVNEKADKNVTEINQIRNKQRVNQLELLEKLAENLSSTSPSIISDQVKTAILAGAMYLVRGQIAIEYHQDPTGTDDNNSLVHKELTSILDAKNSIKEFTEQLVTAAHDYIRHQLVQKNEDTESIRSAHRFSTVDFSYLTSLLNLAQAMIRKCRDAALERCVNLAKNAEEAGKPKAATSSASSSIFRMFSWWQAVDESEEHKEQDEEKAVAASSSAY